MTPTEQLLRDALEDTRNWFESERKSISKGNGSQWSMWQCEEQRDVIDAVLIAATSQQEEGEPERLDDDFTGDAASAVGEMAGILFRGGVPSEWIGKRVKAISDDLIALHDIRAAAPLPAQPQGQEAWQPKFDAMHAQEQLAIKFCQEIAGKRGEKPSPPDPVRLLEMAEALYLAERNDADPPPAPLNNDDFAGWKLVPIQPTLDMIKAAQFHTEHDEERGDPKNYRARGQAAAVWHDMIAASPSAAQGEGT